MMHLYLIFFSLFPLAIIGILLPGAAGARRGMAFGVSLPLAIADSVQVKAALRRFRLRCWLSTGAIGAVLALLLGLAGTQQWIVLATPAGVLVALALAVTFWQEERREVRRLSVPTPVVRTAELKQRGSSLPYALGGWSAFLPLAATALWLRAHWAQLPQSWPEHWDANGVVNGWGSRTVAGVYGPLALGVAVVLVTQAAVSLVAFAPGPERSRRQSMMLPMSFFAGVLSLGACAIGLLPVMGRATPDRVLLGSAIVSVFLLGFVLWGLSRSGTLRTGNTPPTLPAYDGTPDAGWKGGGLIYYNPSDAAVLVSKRLGVGWTLNFARPLAWIYLGGLIAFIAGVSIFAGAR